MSRVAVLVEDDPQQLEYACGALEDAGFEVQAFSSIAAARRGAMSEAIPELVVLDRRLPVSPEDEPDDDAGDTLLEEWLGIYRTTPFIVLTGFSGIEHMQFVTTERGQIAVGGTHAYLDRVRAFTKEQTLQFEQYIRAIADAYDELDAIELIWLGSGDGRAQRLLKRVAQSAGGVSVTASALVGGLADAPVFSCVIADESHRVVASSVVKAVDPSAQLGGGGLHSVLPAPYVAAHVGTLDVLASRSRVVVMQVAGQSPVPLLKLLVEDEATALATLRSVIAWPWPEGNLQTTTIAEIVRPLLEWSTLEMLLSGAGVQPPPAGLLASSRFGVQHGDLHPGNVLLSDGEGVLIDFEEECVASILLDPVTLMLSPWFHKDSPVREQETPRLVSVQSTAPAWLAEIGDSDWLRTCWEWVESRVTSPRELHAVTMAYAARQLKYGDVKQDPVAKDRARRLAQACVNHLANS